jgi:membrane protease YdiL (CAAX protease family)
MNQITEQPRRSPLAIIFLSPDETRLRTGWRLLLHTLLLGAITTFLIFAYILALGFPNLTTSTEPHLLTGIQLLVITLTTWIARRYIDRRSFRSLGFHIDKHTMTDLALGFCLSALMMGLIFAFEWGMGWLHFEGWMWNAAPIASVFTGLLGGLATFIIVGYYEELLFRGYHLQNMIEGTNLSWALFLSSAVFSILHIGNPNSTWASTLGLLAAGCFMAYGWVRTRRLWLSIGLHIGWNFFEGPVFGFPVSGLSVTHLIRQSVVGPVLITGGAFGPEAGLVILPVIALSAALIWVYTGGKQAKRG